VNDTVHINVERDLNPGHCLWRRGNPNELEVAQQLSCKMAKNLFLHAIFCFFSFAYQILITTFGSLTFIYS
jgi:hypothetical protein